MLSAFAPHLRAAATPPTTLAPLLPTHDIFQFGENGTWLENIAIRPNGDLLVTMLSPTPSLYTLTSPYSTNREFSLLHTFDNATGLLGIAETDIDSFAMLSVQLTDTLQPVPGSSTIWGVSFQHGNLDTRKIASIPDVELPNGVASVPGSSALLVADGRGGTITRYDTRTGESSVFLQCPETAPLPSAPNSTGINGIHYREGHIYWSNSALVSIFRIRVDGQGYPAVEAEVEKIGQIEASFIDDFAEDHVGTSWVATNSDNTIVALRSDGSREVVAGEPGKFTLAGCTAAAFGRTPHDRRMLYVTTSGAIRAPINGATEPAKIVAVDTSKYAEGEKWGK